MSALKILAREWLPPALVRLLRRVRGKEICFEGDFSSWDEAKVHCTGYDANEILTRVLASTLKVKHGEAAFERDSVLFDEIEYAWPVLAELMWVAASDGGRLNVLDFGGALGSSYFQNRKFLQTIKDVRWNVIEQPHYVEAGLKHIQDKRLRFYETVEECLAENQPNVILLSSVLQYLEQPFELLEKLSGLNVDRIIVDRTPFVDGDRNILSIQHVPASIFPATLAAWLFSEKCFERVMNRLGYVLVAGVSNQDDSSGRFKLKGYLFCRGKS